MTDLSAVLDSGTARAYRAALYERGVRFVVWVETYRVADSYEWTARTRAIATQRATNATARPALDGVAAATVREVLPDGGTRLLETHVP
jgi:hypothetical protein